MSLVLCAKALPEGWRLLSRVAGTVARVERFLHSPAGPSFSSGRRAGRTAPCQMYIPVCLRNSQAMN